MARYYLLLHVMLFVFAASGIFSKLAGRQVEWLYFALCMGVVFLIMLIYAIAWQQIVKKIPLSIAFVNKSVTVLWSLLFGIVFFDESLTAGKVLGVALVMVGMIVYTSAGENAHE